MIVSILDDPIQIPHLGCMAGDMRGTPWSYTINVILSSDVIRLSTNPSRGRSLHPGLGPDLAVMLQVAGLEEEGGIVRIALDHCIAVLHVIALR